MPHIKNRTYQISAGLLLADIVLFSAVNPTKASAPWLIAGYVLLCATIWCAINVTSSVVGLHQSGFAPLSRRFNRYMVILLSLLIGLQSVGQLTAKDTIALAPLLALAYLYFGYGKRLAAERV